MQADTIRTLAEHIAEQHRRDRFNYGTNGGGAFDSTIEDNSTGDQRDRSGDERCDPDSGG
jgi:hypothetical protein